MERVDKPKTADEHTSLDAFLDWYRATVCLKVAGMPDASARRALVPSSVTTCAGIVRHLTWVERKWFREVLQGETLRPPRPPDDQDFIVTERDSLPDLLRDYEVECENSRKVSAAWNLDDVARDPEHRESCRWVLLHMIEETARHVGHLDLLREVLDGVVGY